MIDFIELSPQAIAKLTPEEQAIYRLEEERFNLFLDVLETQGIDLTSVEYKTLSKDELDRLTPKQKALYDTSSKFVNINNKILTAVQNKKRNEDLTIQNQPVPIETVSQTASDVFIKNAKEMANSFIDKGIKASENFQQNLKQSKANQRQREEDTVNQLKELKGLLTDYLNLDALYKKASVTTNQGITELQNQLKAKEAELQKTKDVITAQATKYLETKRDTNWLKELNTELGIPTDTVPSRLYNTYKAEETVNKAIAEASEEDYDIAGTYEKFLKLYEKKVETDKQVSQAEQAFSKDINAYLESMRGPLANQIIKGATDTKITPQAAKVVSDDLSAKNLLEKTIASNLLNPSYKNNSDIQVTLAQAIKANPQAKEQLQALIDANSENVSASVINSVLAPVVPAGIDVFELYNKQYTFYDIIINKPDDTPAVKLKPVAIVSGVNLLDARIPYKEDLSKIDKVYHIPKDNIVLGTDGKPYDGDTLRVKTADGQEQSLRLIGLDAYEATQGGLAGKARDRLAELIKDGFYIRTFGNEGYGRTLAVIYDDKGNNISAQMIKEGLVFRMDYKNKTDLPQDVLIELNAAAKHAIDNKLGIHSGTNINVDPNVYRQISDDSVKDKKEGKAVGTAINAEAIEGKTADDQESDYNPRGLKNGSEFNNLLADPAIGHLSRLYDHYYTSADCKVYIKAPGDSPKYVMADLITGIGYTYTVSSVPIYTIGSRFPAFFTTGNSIGNGSIIFPFKSAEYLRRMLKYVFNEYSPNVHTIGDDGKPKDTSQMSDEEFINASQSADNKDSLNPFPVTDIGSIVSLFDIHIRLNNRNAYYEGRDHSNQTTTHVIILKNCKLISENLEITSTRDGTIQHGFQFVFQNVLLGES